MMEEKKKEYCKILQIFVYDREFCNDCIYKCVHSKREIMDGLKR